LRRPFKIERNSGNYLSFNAHVYDYWRHIWEKQTMDTSGFTGSEEWYRHPLVKSVVYTQGVKYVAEQGEAYWFIDKIATMQLDDKVRKHEFQVWKLDVPSKLITVEDGNGLIIYKEKLDYTDFPAPGVTLWFTDHTILVPSEY
jgi:hypothetical protein